MSNYLMYYMQDCFYPKIFLMDNRRTLVTKVMGVLALHHKKELPVNAPS